MDWVAPNTTGSIIPVRNSHRSEVYKDNVLIFGGRSINSCLDDIHLYNPSI